MVLRVSMQFLAKNDGFPPALRSLSEAGSVAEGFGLSACPTTKSPSSKNHHKKIIPLGYRNFAFAQRLGVVHWTKTDCFLIFDFLLVNLGNLRQTSL